MEYRKIKNDSTWGDIASAVNNNFDKTAADIIKLKHSTYLNKGYFESVDGLNAVCEKPKPGDIAWIGIDFPGTVWKYDKSTDGKNAWINTEVVPDMEEVKLTDYVKEDRLLELQSDVTTVRGQLDSVETRVTTVEGLANNVQQTANGALSSAQNAAVAADNAQQTADSALYTAQNASTAADDAQRSADALSEQMVTINEVANGAIPRSWLGDKAADKVATLDENSLIPRTQIPNGYWLMNDLGRIPKAEMDETFNNITNSGVYHYEYVTGTKGSGHWEVCEGFLYVIDSYFESKLEWSAIQRRVEYNNTEIVIHYRRGTKLKDEEQVTWDSWEKESEGLKDLGTFDDAELLEEAFRSNLEVGYYKYCIGSDSGSIPSSKTGMLKVMRSTKDRNSYAYQERRENGLLYVRNGSLFLINDGWIWEDWKQVFYISSEEKDKLSSAVTLNSNGLIPSNYLDGSLIKNIGKLNDYEDGFDSFQTSGLYQYQINRIAGNRTVAYTNGILEVTTYEIRQPHQKVTKQRKYEHNAILEREGSYLYYGGEEIMEWSEWKAMKTNGSGGNIFNITAEIPLESGFYTLETAIPAVPVDNRRKGLVVTFEDTAGSWKSYQFIASSLASWEETDSWEEFGGAGTIKKIILNKEELSPDKDGNVIMSVDETLTANSINPVQGKAIYAAIESLDYGTQLQLNTIGEGDNKAYSISLLGKDGEIINTTESFTGGGGGSVSTTRMVLERQSDNPTIKLGDKVELQFKYDQIDTTSGSSTGTPGQATITISRSANSFSYTQEVLAGSENKLDVTKYLALGANAVKVRVVTGSDEEQQVASISWTVTCVELKLTSSFNIASVITKGDLVNIPFSLSGTGNKTLRCYVDGVDIEDRGIVTSTANGSFSVNTSAMAHGSHSVQLVAELELSTGMKIQSNSIYFDLAVRESDKMDAVFASRFDYSDGTIIGNGKRPFIPVAQYGEFSITYAVYNPRITPAEVLVYEGNALVSSSKVSFVRTVLNRRSMELGNVPCKLVCAGTEYVYDLQVEKTAVDVTEPTDSMILKLSATGRSNSDTNREEWTYNGVTTKFSGLKWGGDGWMNNALRLNDNARAEVQVKLLEQPEFNATNAFTFVIKFKATEVTDDDAEIVRCVDENGTGFIITPQEARMLTKGKSSLSMQMASGQEYEIGFVSYPKAEANSSEHEILNSEMLYLYINGILSGGVQRGTSDSIYQNNAQYIALGAAGATLDVYLMRGYNSYLSDSQMLDCYILDQNSVDSLVAKYNSNNIVDGNGFISVNSIPDDMRYVIVTGKQANGVATILQAAVNNDKDPKYDVDEILCIKRSEPKLNFRLVGGCIRLQGTSSLAYPIKNYRIYLNNSKKVDGQLYLGCDSQGIGGELQPKAKYSFKLSDTSNKRPAPVNCFCLKADFAESSSSHNTGLARLANDVLKAANELTPAQKYVSPSFENDVRTTVDGEPCLLFYRETINDTPVLVGKFNFNNDKSTEAVFGFLDVPGYHDQAWVTQKFGGKNPTECWEFLNNDYPMGMFLDDDFEATDEKGYPNWLKVFESRYPDVNDEYEAGTREPVYLKRLVKWVKSTSANGAKFRNELSDYFAVDYLCDYFMFTEMFGCVDQRVKNMMFGFWYSPDDEKVLCYPIFYDCDTILGVRNDGRLKYRWDIDENTIDPELTKKEKTVYAYAGHDSVLWNNLRVQFADKLKAAYQRLREKMTNDYIFNVFDNEQAAKFCERLYNLDAQYKYVRPLTLGVEVNQNGVVFNKKYSHLESMQGSRAAHRRWWITNRMNLLDAKYSAGQYSLTDITWKGHSAAEAIVKATPARDFYFEFRREGTTMIHEAVKEGEEWSYKYEQEANIGTIFHLLGGVFMSKLDLSGWGGFTDVNLPNLPILEELVMGKPGTTYTLTELVIDNKLPMLRKLNIQNYTQIPSLDLSGCNRLEEVNASGCESLSVLTFAEGAPISKVTFPANYQTLMLRSLPNITREGIVFENKANLTGLWVENCEKLDGFTLFRELFAASNSTLKYVRLTNLNLEGNGSDLKAWYDAGLGGIGIDGATINGKCKLCGTYRLTSYLDESLYAKLVSRFDELDIIQPQYTVLQLDDSIADPANITNFDNNTGCYYQNDYQPNAHVLTILNKRHRVLGKRYGEGKMAICRLDDNNSQLFAADKTMAAPLTGEEGNVYVYEPHYWYKGVNDILRKKKYMIFSSNDEMPQSVGESLRLGKDDIEVTPGMAVSARSTAKKLDDILETYEPYSTCKVDLDPKFKVIRFPIAITPTKLTDKEYGAVFADAQGNILSYSTKIEGDQEDIYGNIIAASGEVKYKSRFCVKETDGITSGMYLFAPIPPKATQLYFTISNDVDFDYVLLNTSDRVEDVEPDWVEHDACLCGVYEASVKNDLLWSVSGVASAEKITLVDFKKKANALGTGFQLIDYELSKDVANLFYAKYGTRDSQGQCGYGTNNAYESTGKTDFLGMRDTQNLDENTTSNAYFYEGDTLITLASPNVMGYENFYGNKTEYMDKVIYSKGSKNKVWSITMPDGMERAVKGHSTDVRDVYPIMTAHGRYMDVIGMTPGGSQSQYYCDQQHFSYEMNRAVRRGNSHNSGSAGITYFTTAGDGAAENYSGTRLMFRGEIEEKNITEFKTLEK